MTTTTKKSLIAILMLVFVFVCCFTAIGASADDLEFAGKAGFEKYVTEQIKDAGITADNIFSAAHPDYAKKVHKAIDLYTALGNDDKAALSADVKATYEAIQKASAEPFAVESYVVSILYDKLNNYDGERFYLSDEATLDTYYAKYEGLTAEAKAWVENLPENAFDNFAKAYARLAELKAKLQAAIDAIDAIVEYNNEIVLASEDSIDAAFDAMYDIYDTDFLADEFAEEWALVTNLDDYHDAVEALANQYAKAAAVEETIANVYASVEEGVVYYTKLADIEDARADYNALDDVAYNNLKAEVSNYDLLEEMEDVIAGIEDEIDDVEAAIANIGTVVFTTDCAEKIDAARDAFEALDADIVAADKAAAAGEPTIVANYATLVEAEAKYAELAEDFAELKASIDAMAAAFDSQTNILAKYIEARTLYLKAEAVAPEMVARLAGEAFDNVDYPTYAEAYDFYAARALAMEGKVNVIIAAINNFVVKWNNTVTLDDADCATELVGIKADYDSLASDMERAAVTNSHIMFEKLAELEDLLAVADVWVDAVNAIVEPITATDASFGQVLAAKAEFEKLSTGAQATMASIAVTADDSVWNKYAEAYDKYADTLADYNYLNNLIKDLADDMGAIVAPTNLTAEATWRAGVEAIADRYEDLEDVDDNAQAYLEAHYLTEYKHFIAMMRHIALVDAYEAIEALPDAADVEITDRAEIAAARALVDAYDGDLADIINLAKLEDVEAARDAIIARLEKWESDVLALVGNYDNIANIIVDANALPIDLAKAYALKATYDAMPVAEQDYTAEDNVDDYAKLVEIITKAEAKATTVAEAMEDVVALGDNVETTDIADIIAVDDAYSDLSESQKAYIDANYPGLAEAFIKQVQKLIIADSFESIVDELYDAVVASGYDITSDTPVILGLVKSMYNSFTKEQRALIGNYNKVGEIEAAYEAALAAGKVVNVTELNGIVANIKAALEVAEGDIDALQAALTAANDQIKLLDEQLELAQSNHAKDLAEANKNVETLQGTVTTIIIIFSILVAGLVAAVVVLFIKRK